MPVRTRFAPSPTGALHIGSVRTALFSYLFARHHGGVFVLRIEDTDRERSTEESTRAILEGLGWLGLAWDEGPYHQSERLALYRARAEALLAAGAVYRCWCTPEELEARRQAALAAGRRPAYDRTCRDRTAPPPGRAAHALRFRTPLEGETVIDDHVKGRVVFQNAELDDFIIVRSDGMPVYNFCVVVDDHDMRITHVIRGDDLLASTPRQMLLYAAFGATPPHFAHVPQILGVDKARLSKRHGATSVLAYREMGYLPDALVNYLARLGWSHGDQELFTRSELITHFSLENVGKAAGIFNPEKILWVNFQYLKATPTAELAEQIVPFLERAGLPVPTDRAWLTRALETLHEREDARRARRVLALLPRRRDRARARSREAPPPRDCAGARRPGRAPRGAAALGGCHHRGGVPGDDRRAPAEARRPRAARTGGRHGRHGEPRHLRGTRRTRPRALARSTARCPRAPRHRRCARAT